MFSVKLNIKSRRGFTLIELLVVIGILAVLAAIAIPSVAGLIDRANKSADQTNANEMTNAIERFTSEYELYCQDIANKKIADSTTEFDSAQGRVHNVISAKTRAEIEAIEIAQDATVDENRILIYRDTKYPANVITVRKIVKNYMKTSSSTFEPKQSDMHFWYSPECGVVVVAKPESTKAELNNLVVSGKDAKGEDLDDTNAIWLDITAYCGSISFNTQYVSDFIQTDGGNFLVVSYTFWQDGCASSSFKTYAPDKSTIIDTTNTSYSQGSFTYEKEYIKYDSYKFGTITNDGETILQLGTSYGDVPLNRSE